MSELYNTFSATVAAPLITLHTHTPMCCLCVFYFPDLLVYIYISKVTWLRDSLTNTPAPVEGTCLWSTPIIPSSQHAWSEIVSPSAPGSQVRSDHGYRSRVLPNERTESWSLWSGFSLLRGRLTNRQKTAKYRSTLKASPWGYRSRSIHAIRFVSRVGVVSGRTPGNL